MASFALPTHCAYKRVNLCDSSDTWHSMLSLKLVMNSTYSRGSTLNLMSSILGREGPSLIACAMEFQTSTCSWGGGTGCSGKVTAALGLGLGWNYLLVTSSSTPGTSNLLESCTSELAVTSGMSCMGPGLVWSCGNGKGVSICIA